MNGNSRNVLAAILIFLFPPISLGNDWQKTIISPDGFAYVNMKKMTTKNQFIIEKYNILEKTHKTYNFAASTSGCYNVRADSTSPKGDKISLIAICESDTDGRLQKFYRLMILDTRNGKEIRCFNNGHKSSFSPDGKEIAFTEQIFGERGSQPPLGYRGGMWIYNFHNNRAKRVSDGDFASSDINWSPHDNNIYVCYYDEVSRYNVSLARLEPTEYRGIYFSPNGLYYVSTPNESGAKIYQTSDNREMIEWGNLIKAKCRTNAPQMRYRLWSKQLNALVISPGPDWQNVVFSIPDGDIAGEFEGFVIGSNYNGTVVAIHPMKPDGTWYDQQKVNFINLAKFKK